MVKAILGGDMAVTTGRRASADAGVEALLAAPVDGYPALPAS